MDIPKDYAEIEDSPLYREAQDVGVSVSRSTGPEEYWHWFDSQEMRLLSEAKSSNITYYLEEFLAAYRLRVGLEGYVREPESFARTIRRLLMPFWPQPPLSLKGTMGRPHQGRIQLHLPLERQEQIFQRLRPEVLAAVIQAAFARKHYQLMRVYSKSEDAGRRVLKHLRGQYEKMMLNIIP